MSCNDSKIQGDVLGREDDSFSSGLSLSVLCVWDSRVELLVMGFFFFLVYNYS